jgi:hypothetical protein
MLMESIGQDECLWFAPIQLFDSILLSPISRKNEEILKVKIPFSIHQPSSVLLYRNR